MCVEKSYIQVFRVGDEARSRLANEGERGGLEVPRGSDEQIVAMHPVEAFLEELAQCGLDLAALHQLKRIRPVHVERRSTPHTARPSRHLTQRVRYEHHDARQAGEIRRLLLLIATTTGAAVAKRCALQQAQDVLGIAVVDGVACEASEVNGPHVHDALDQVACAHAVEEAPATLEQLGQAHQQHDLFDGEAHRLTPLLHAVAVAVVGHGACDTRRPKRPQRRRRRHQIGPEEETHVAHLGVRQRHVHDRVEFGVQPASSCHAAAV